jgi:hypothetical protein
MIDLYSLLGTQYSVLPPAAFVTPGLAIAGALLVAVPIVIHLLNRRRFKRVEWAAMRFVLEAMKRNRKRLRFESWLLLALRCLVIGLLGLGLARPLGCDNAMALAAGRDRAMHLFVLDNSGSTMLRRDDATTFDLIRNAATGVLELQAGDVRAAAFAAAAPASDVVAEPTYDLGEVAAAVATMQATSLSTDVAGALERALVAAEVAEPGERVIVHVLTDAAAEALADPRLESLSDRLVANAEVRVYRPVGEPPGNVAVVVLRAGESLVRDGFDVPILGTIAAPTGNTRTTTATWRVAGSIIDAPAVTAEAESTEIAASPRVADAIEPGRSRVVSLGITGDDALTDDDVRYAVIERVADLPVLVVEGGRSVELGGAGTSLLATALSPGEASYVDVERASDLELADLALDPYRAIVLNDVGGIDEAVAARLQTFVQNGGTLMNWLGGRITATNANDILGSRSLLPGTLVRQIDATTRSDLGLVGFDFDPTDVHPLLDGFRGAEDSGLAAPYFRRYWELEPDETADIVLSFAGTASPAVLSHRVGAGRIITVASAASDPEWSVLPLARNFASFLHDLLGNAIGTAGGGSGWQNLVAGDTLIVPASAGLPTDATPQLVGDGETIRLTRRTRDDGTFAWTSPPLVTPGVFELAAGDVRLPVVVNRPADESDATPADGARLRDLFGDDVAILDLSAETTEDLAAEADRPDWGWTLIVLAMLLAMAEVAYASFLGRSRS